MVARRGPGNSHPKTSYSVPEESPLTEVDLPSQLQLLSGAGASNLQITEVIFTIRLNGHRMSRLLGSSGGGLPEASWGEARDAFFFFRTHLAEAAAPPKTASTEATT